jgi:putative ABC transport system permease protein
MFTYYLDLAMRSFKRNVALTILMIVAIGFGVGASMTTLTVLHVLSADPIPHKSKVLHFVQLDPRPLNGFVPGREPLNQMTRYDSETLLREHRADHQALMTGGSAAIEPQRPGLDPFRVDGRWTSNEFFPMFDVPFLKGHAWTAEDDAAHARVVVISKALADKVFGNADVIGFSLRVENTEMRVVGVLDNWRPTPHFFDLATDVYGKGEDIFVPWATAMDLKMGHDGEMSCWSDTGDDNTALMAPCSWTQYWVELGTDEKLETFNQYLINYSKEQYRQNRYGRPPNVRLRNVTDYLEYNKVVPSDARLQMYVAFGFLLVCLINTVGLLLTKFLRRSSEIGVRRALGASRRAIFVQLLVEAGVIGFVGGLFGLLLAALGLWAVRHQPTSYAELAKLDWPMLLATFLLAVITSVLAGIVPAWRGCQVTPAIQLKSL